MRFSIIISTRNRPEQLNKIVSDLIVQDTDQEYEVIVIDQSNIAELLGGSLYNKPPVRYIKTNLTGLSVGRNIGLEYSSGEILCLMDDDARVTKTYLSDIQKVFSEDESIGIGCGLIKNIEDDLFYSKYMNSKNKIIVNWWNIDRCLSTSMFFKKEVYDKIGGFDIIFGAGKYFGSSEETEFLIRAIVVKIKICAFNKPIVEHPKFEFKNQVWKNLFNKGKSYGLGRGALYKKYFKIKPFWSLIQIFRVIIFSFFQILINLLMFNFKVVIWRSALLIGRITGFIKFKEHVKY